MRSPLFRLPARTTTLVVAVVSVAGGLALGTVGPAAVATAGDLVGSAGIKDGSIVGRDLKDGSVRGVDIRDGSITAADLDGGINGVVGPAGPKGDRGAVGPQGEPGLTGGQADGVATWTVHHDADGQSSVHFDSADTIPAGAELLPLDGTVTGDFSGCNPYYGYGGFGRSRGGQLASFRYGSVDPAPTSGSRQVVFGGPTHLTFDASCLDMSPAPKALPTFDATITFQWTVLDPTPTTSFN